MTSYTTRGGGQWLDSVGIRVEPALAMSALEVESRITEVTLDARAARVRRQAEIAQGPAAPRVRLWPGAERA